MGPIGLNKCTSRGQFTLERYHSLQKEGVVALLVDHNKIDTTVNNIQSLLPNSRSGLINGDIIGISYLNKDMKKEHYAAFIVSIINSLISENQFFQLWLTYPVTVFKKIKN